jgi:predicted permease
MGFILSKLLMMFAAIGAAFVAVKKGLWGKEGNMVFSKAVTYVLNPATILASTMTGERPLSNKQVLILVAIAFTCYAFLIATSFLIPKLLICKQ